MSKPLWSARVQFVVTCPAASAEEMETKVNRLLDQFAEIETGDTYWDDCEWVTYEPYSPDNGDDADA